VLLPRGKREREREREKEGDASGVASSNRRTLTRDTQRACAYIGSESARKRRRVGGAYGFLLQPHEHSFEYMGLSSYLYAYRGIRKQGIGVSKQQRERKAETSKKRSRRRRRKKKKSTFLL
jgi:hypothetical protein